MASIDDGDARADLASLAGRALDWHRFAPARMVVDVSHARRSAVLMLFGPTASGAGVAPAATTPPAGAAATAARPIGSAAGDAACAAGTAPADTDVLLLERAHTLRHHPGQIGFPGGGLEPDDADLTATAVREAVEETGVDPAGIEVFPPLRPLPLAVSDNLVTPVPAWWRHPSPVHAVDQAETAEVFRVRVADLLDPANRVSVARVRGRRTMPAMPAFQVDGHLVWGFTAIILSALFDTLDWTVPWDATRLVEPDV